MSAQQLAFPTAEGAGKYTKGARGTTLVPTTVYYVTNLADDGTYGTLRYGVATLPGTYKTIMFKVSGTIHLLSNLSIKKNTTLAGQTAPGDGICLADHNTTISGDNVIVRYLHFRLGDKNQNLGMVNGSGGDDALSATGRKNIIIDHCTFSWSDDESCSVYAGDSTTVQWCMMAEPLNYSYHFETGDADYEHHGYGGIWGGRSATFHHNLLAHCQGRACRFDGSRNLDGGATPGKENCLFSNNVIYNWGAYNTNGGEGGNYNIINNYYKYGPSTQSSSKTMVINPYITAPLPYGKYYVTGNYMDGSPTVTNNNWLGAKMSSGTAADTTQAKVTTAFPLPTINTETALDAYNSVLAGAGVAIPGRDTLEERIIGNVKNRTGKIIDCQGGYPHLTPYATTVNAWPTLVSGVAPTDTDIDGMPDWWETREGLNINLASDRATLTVDGYTVLEKYLNSIPAWNAHANFVAVSGTKLNTTTAQISFTTDWVKDGFKYGLFRSNDSIVGYTKVADTISNMNLIHFAINDATLPTGVWYYKIGSYKIGVTPDTLYSNFVKINNTVTAINNPIFGDDITAVYPNPAQEEFTVKHVAALKNATIQVVDKSGKICYQINVKQGATSTIISQHKLARGSYVVVFNNGKIKSHSSIVIM